MTNLSRLKKEIEETIASSRVPEDPDHARNTLHWVLRLKPDADETLQIAALGHDIERALRDSNFRRQAYYSYDSFKEAHAKKSAAILRDMILRLDLPDGFAEAVYRLVARHERGGCPRSDILRDADSLSFFEVNLPAYLEREGWEGSEERCRWGYERLSAPRRRIIEMFRYENPEVTRLVKEILREKGHTI
ncbi:MAG: DUF4202 family protein [Deltaproteobacteria bacterium]|nr:DUF4202 family protein [Deltaproteobacteria bacterium]